MPDKRGERIGRAAWDAVHTSVDPWGEADPRARVDYRIIALAAVAEAREIDRCHNCDKERDAKGDPDCRILIFMAEIHKTSVVAMSRQFYCNRHEPKE